MRALRILLGVVATAYAAGALAALGATVMALIYVWDKLFIYVAIEGFVLGCISAAIWETRRLVAVGRTRKAKLVFSVGALIAFIDTFRSLRSSFSHGLDSVVDLVLFAAVCALYVAVLRLPTGDRSSVGSDRRK